MLWFVDIASPHRVVVDVCQLLAQHRLGLNDLRVASLLPMLKLPVSFVPEFVVLQNIQQRSLVSLAKVVDDLSRRV